MSPIKIDRLIVAILTVAISIETTSNLTIAQPQPHIIIAQANFAKLYLIGGKKKWDEEKYREAIELLDKAISADPGNAEAHFWRGLSYDSLREFDLAVADFDRTIALDKEYGLAYYMRGMNYSSKKKYDLAITDLEVATKLLRASGDDAYAVKATQTIGMLKALR
jgi:tetratricopeptide (TPR) repeat protein